MLLYLACDAKCKQCTRFFRFKGVEIIISDELYTDLKSPLS